MSSLEFCFELKQIARISIFGIIKTSIEGRITIKPQENRI